MNAEEKILEMLEKMSNRMDQMQTTQAQMQTTQAQMQADITAMKDDISGLKTTQQKQGETLSDLQKTVTRVALTQENIVLKSLNALAEGQDLTHQRLKDLAGKDELADLREEVRLLRSVVAQHSRDIEALKAAQ